jgi:putative membrane protein
MRRHEIPEGESLWREHLANERTTLSWIRTGINMIGVGILLGIISRAADDLPLLSSREGEFLLLGLGLTALGILIEAGALLRFIRYDAELERGGSISSARLYLIVSLGLVLLGVAFLGLVILS